MRRFPPVTAALALVTLGLALSFGSGRAPAQQQNEQDGDILFLWAFGAIVEKEHKPKFVPVVHDMAMKSGDRIKFFVKPEKRCFVYLIYHSSQGKLSVLFPYRFKNLDDDFLPAQEHYIPQGDEWFELDEHRGNETFYLLASASRLRALEDLVNQYETADGGRKQELVKTILTEIRRLRWENRNFKTYAERPVTTMGNIRGGKKVGTGGAPDVAGIAVEISGETFYGRTFTIVHE
jgi:hypothetical protein